MQRGFHCRGFAKARDAGLARVLLCCVRKADPWSESNTSGPCNRVSLAARKARRPGDGVRVFKRDHACPAARRDVCICDGDADCSPDSVHGNHAAFSCGDVLHGDGDTFTRAANVRIRIIRVRRDRCADVRHSRAWVCRRAFCQGQLLRRARHLGWRTGWRQERAPFQRAAHGLYAKCFASSDAQRQGNKAGPMHGDGYHSPEAQDADSGTNREGHNPARGAAGFTIHVDCCDGGIVQCHGDDAAKADDADCCAGIPCAGNDGKRDPQAVEVGGNEGNRRDVHASDHHALPNYAGAGAVDSNRERKGGTTNQSSTCPATRHGNSSQIKPDIQSIR